MRHGRPACGRLVAHSRDRCSRRPDPGDPRPNDGIGKGGVLGQESVAGMQRVSARAPSHVHDRVRIEVVGDRESKVDPVRSSVVRRVDADRPDPEQPRSAGNPLHDLTAVRDQERADGRRTRCRRVGHRPKRRARHANPSADPNPGQPAIGDPALDGADRDAELLRDFAGGQRLIGHVAIVAEAGATPRARRPCACRGRL